MKGKILYIILPIFFFFFNINIALADETVNCAVQQEKIETYNYLKKQLDGIDCTDSSNETYVAICNDSNVKKNLIVTELMKLDDENAICSSKQDEVDEIIEENKDKCGQIFDDSFSDFVNGFMTFFYIIGPILLLLFGSLDFAKATVSAEQDALKNAWINFSKRIVATLLLFLTPTIVNFIISFNTTNKYLSGNAYSCDFDYLVYTKEYNIKYIPRQNITNDSSSIGGTKIGNYTIFSQGDQSWGSNQLLCSSSNTISSAGCALTAVAMQIVNSGVETIEIINPGTLNKIMKINGSCPGGNLVWDETIYATNGKFVKSANVNITGNITQKAEQLKDYIKQGYYPVIQVKDSPISGGTHYVAVFEVNGSEILIGDPAGGNLSILNNTTYPIVTESYPSQAVLYYIK